MRQTLLKKRLLAVTAMIEARTPNTMEIAALWPIEVVRSDRREQGLRRLLKKGLLASAEVREPFARQAVEEAARSGRTLRRSRDQTAIGERCAILGVGVWRGDRALPLAG